MNRGWSLRDYRFEDLDKLEGSFGYDPPMVSLDKDSCLVSYGNLSGFNSCQSWNSYDRKTNLHSF